MNVASVCLKAVNTWMYLCHVLPNVIWFQQPLNFHYCRFVYETYLSKDINSFLRSFSLNLYFERFYSGNGAHLAYFPLYPQQLIAYYAQKLKWASVKYLVNKRQRGVFEAFSFSSYGNILCLMTMHFLDCFIDTFKWRICHVKITLKKSLL